MVKLCRCEAVAQAERMLSQPYIKNGVWRVKPLHPKGGVDCPPAGFLAEAIRARRDAVAVLALELMGWDLQAAYDYVESGLERFGPHPEASVEYVVTCALEDLRLAVSGAR